MRTLLTALVFQLAAAAALADVIHLADGTVRQGRIVESNDQEVVVDFGAGSVSLVTRIPRAQILRIVEKPSPQESLMSGYVARLAKANQGTADDWVALALWCRDQRVLKEQADEAFRRALALDPENKRAHAALGHVKFNDAWMTPQEVLALLVPNLADLKEEAKAREAAQKQAAEAQAKLLEVTAQLQKLQSQMDDLEKDNREMRRQFALPPVVYPPRVIYRPIIIPPLPPPRPHPPRPRVESGDGPSTESKGMDSDGAGDKSTDGKGGKSKGSGSK